MDGREQQHRIADGSGRAVMMMMVVVMVVAVLSDASCSEADCIGSRRSSFIAKCLFRKHGHVCVYVCVCTLHACERAGHEVGVAGGVFSSGSWRCPVDSRALGCLSRSDSFVSAKTRSSSESPRKLWGVWPLRPLRDRYVCRTRER